MNPIQIITVEREALPKVMINRLFGNSPTKKLQFYYNGDFFSVFLNYTAVSDDEISTIN